MNLDEHIQSLKQIHQDLEKVSVEISLLEEAKKIKNTQRNNLIQKQDEAVASFFKDLHDNKV